MRAKLKRQQQDEALYAQILVNCLATAHTAEAAQAEAKSRYNDVIRQRDREKGAETPAGRWIATIMLVITLGTYLRAAYDYVGLNVLRLLHAAPEVHKSIIQNAMLHFLFLNGLIVALVWAALPALREWANAKYIAELNRADKSKR